MGFRALKEIEHFELKSILVFATPLKLSLKNMFSSAHYN